MDYSTLKALLFQGIGRTTFQDENNADITSQTLCHAINIGQMRLARREAFGRLYKRENIFLASGEYLLTPLTNIRATLDVHLFGTETETYVAQTTDLPSGVYVDGSNNVYILNTSDRKALTGKLFDEMLYDISSFYAETGEPDHYALFDKDSMHLDALADDNYFVSLYCKAWPTEFTTSSTTETSDIKNGDDLILLLAQAWLYTTIMKEPDKANQIYAVFKNELKHMVRADHDIENVDVYIKTIRDEDEAFPRAPGYELSATDLGI